MLNASQHCDPARMPPTKKSYRMRTQEQPPWNKGRLLGQKLPLKLKEIWGIRIRLQMAKKLRDLALFNLAIDSKLRACDLVKLRRRDIESDGKIQTRAYIIQKKTNRPVQFEITEQTRQAIEEWLKSKYRISSDFLFPSRSQPHKNISTRQYSRIVKSWVKLLGLDPSHYGTHTLRRTKVTLIYRQTKNLRAIQLLLGHTKLESTVRYLGIEVDDALAISENTET